MLNNKELVILSHFRENARKNLTRISRETKIPVSTIFDKMKKYEGDVVKRYTTLLDFSKLGYDVRVTLVLRVPKEKREEFEHFISRSESINSAFRINNGYDYSVELVLKNMREFHEFSEVLESKFKITSKQEYYILEDIKREAFLTDYALFRSV